MKHAALAAALALAFAAGAASADPAPGSPAYQTFYGAFASTKCCWTSQCCRVAEGSEFEPLDGIGKRFRVIASGQETERTGWSPDGQWHVCQCDPVEGGWRKHPAANVRCLFPPMPGY